MKVWEVRRKERGKWDEDARAWSNLPLARYTASKLLVIRDSP